VFVNLGCGSHICEGEEWVNIDNFLLTDVPNFVKGDVRKIPLETASVDYLLCDQVLEHIEMADVPLVLYEIRRVLKPGAKCAIMVPDFEGTVKQWLGYNHNGAFDPLVYKYLSEPVYGLQAHEGEFHKTPMCAGYLHFLLNMVGLTKHTISYWPENGEIPQREGMRPIAKGAVLRNPQLLCDIIR
jgi:predicted SAM-dependent methyltransferase